MAGVKGRSGRKTNANELYKLETIEECWKIVRKAILDESLDFKFRAELAAKHTVKSIPTELTGDLGVTLTAMGTITKSGGEVLEFNIGSKPDVSDPPEDT